MKTLTYKIDEIDYLLFNCPFPINSINSIDEFYNNVNNYSGILQGAKIINLGFFEGKYIDISVLIPQKHALIFSKYME